MRAVSSFNEIEGRLRPGSTLVLHSGCAEPKGLVSHLAASAPRLNNVNVFALMPMGDAPYAGPEFLGHLNVTAFFPGKGLRAAVNNKAVKLLRTPLSGIPDFFNNETIKADVLFLQVSPPDEEGMVSLGLSVDYMRAVLKQDPLLVAEINPAMPFTMGDTRIPLERIDYAFSSTEGPQTVPPALQDDTDRQIASHVASLIDDGCVLQVGIGSLPDLVLGQLGHLKHLGIHSGIITDALVPLIESGIVDNEAKKKFRGVSVTTMAAGSQPFYNFLHRNRAVEFHPCSLTHNHEILSGIERLCAINSVLQIDLQGNANAEVIGGKVISSPGGLPDFARGAAHARDGKSILALRSSSKDGRQSNILLALPTSAPTSVPGEHVDFVVTEYGIAALRGLSADLRAKSLISIAHPAFRDELERDFEMAKGQSS